MINRFKNNITLGKKNFNLRKFFQIFFKFFFKFDLYSSILDNNKTKQMQAFEYSKKLLPRKKHL